MTAYFGVDVPGALFALGDGHCRQGDGEVCGTGVEAAMNTVEGMPGRVRATARDYLAAR